MDTSCSVVPCCASSHSSSSVARSALASTDMATAMAADTAADKADDRRADTAADGSSWGLDIADWKTEGREEEERKRRDKWGWKRRSKDGWREGGWAKRFKITCNVEFPVNVTEFRFPSLTLKSVTLRSDHGFNTGCTFSNSLCWKTSRVFVDMRSDRNDDERSEKINQPCLLPDESQWVWMSGCQLLESYINYLIRSLIWKVSAGCFKAV